MHINQFKSAEQLTDWRNGDALPGNRGMPAVRHRLHTTISEKCAPGLRTENRKFLIGPPQYLRICVSSGQQIVERCNCLTFDDNFQGLNAAKSSRIWLTGRGYSICIYRQKHLQICYLMFPYVILCLIIYFDYNYKNFINNYSLQLNKPAE